MNTTVMARESFARAFGVPDAIGEDVFARLNWFVEHLGLRSDFFSGLLDLPPEDLKQFASGSAVPTDSQLDILHKFYDTMSHILSWRNFELVEVRELLNLALPPAEGSTIGSLPPWSGTSLLRYIQNEKVTGMERVDRWVSKMRFGDATSFS